MLLYLNDDTAEIWSNPTRSPVLRFPFIRGSSPEINVRRTQNGSVSSYGGSAVLTLTFKSSRTAGSVLIPTVTATAIGGNTNQFQPTFLSVDLDTLLDDNDSAIVYGEIKVADSPDLFLFEFVGRVYANTNRGGETVPGVVTSGSPVVLTGITSFTGATATDLPSVATTALTAGSGIPYFFREAATGQFIPVYLDSGAATVGDSGQVAPLDYHATTNNKHWTRAL